jgi:hypothetical protein
MPTEGDSDNARGVATAKRGGDPSASYRVWTEW